MRFNLFGFKGELSTSGQKKKKKTTDDDVIVGTFRIQSEFGPSSSRFKTNSLQNHDSNEIRPKSWCGTPIPKVELPPPQNGYSAEENKSNEKQNKQDKKETKPNEKEIKPNEKETKPKSALKKVAPIPPVVEPKISIEDIKIENKQNEIEKNKNKQNDIEIKQNEIENENFITLGGFETTTSVKNVSFGNETNENVEKKYIKLGGFSDDEDSDDEYGARKSKNQHESSGNFGYSDQAASIFFRSDSPEPEQRVRNFKIRNDENDDDNLSQTSA